MATYSRVLLSGTPGSGRVIPVATTATPGTLIHTAADGAAGFDEVYLWASNVTATPATLTIEFGGVADPDDHIVNTLTIPANSAPIALVSGQGLNGALSISAFSDTDGAINISGFVNRISA